MAFDKIIIKGARENNLKNVYLEIPRDKLIVMTGLSGSGKSSLAFDTIYAEGERRYVESLSAYARQFLGQMDKPDVDYIEGLSPAVSIDQKTTSRNPRSTVGTVTEIYDYMRLLYATVGTVYCYKCGKQISKQTPQQIVDGIMKLPAGTRFQVLAPVARGRKGEYRRFLLKLATDGFSRVRVDGEVYSLEDVPALDKKIKHSVDVVVDRLVMKEDIKRRLSEAVELSLKLADGTVTVATTDGDGTEQTYSEHFACLDCDISYTELAPRLFSFNAPYGACPGCAGLGTKREVDPELVVHNPELSLEEGAIPAWTGYRMSYYPKLLEALGDVAGFSVHVPFRSLSPAHKHLVLYGEPATELSMHWTSADGHTHLHRPVFEGVIPNLNRRYKDTDSEHSRGKIERYMRVSTCPTCHGDRLNPTALSVRLGKTNIAEFAEMSAGAALRFVDQLPALLTEQQRVIAKRVFKEIRQRLLFLVDVGLDYLTLARSAGTLAGGEAQRIRLATQIGSGLMGVLYILDEPSIGLHQRDNRRLIDTLKKLRDLGNTVIVVEHDEETMREADFVVDIGPGPGEHGGEIVAAGTLEDIMNEPRSITGRYLKGEQFIAVPTERRPGSGAYLTIAGATEHNLKDITVDIPLGKFVCVTGVSGSGKSTLIGDVLCKALAAKLRESRERPGQHTGMEGWRNLDKLVVIDQSPIGRTPRSNPATYTGVFSDIRSLFAQTREAKVRGYKPGRFSFNVKGGRCAACDGDGTLKIEMHFLPDVYVTCETCKGRRYNEETLEVKFKGKNIAEVLSLSAEEALSFFANDRVIRRKLQTLYDVGLGYVKLGQSATTLSGGEAQRIKLASELGKVATGNTFYVLDEPTTGLHFADVSKLLDVLQRLVDSGNTVLVIEHNLDVVKSADHIIDLGPEGGDGGGTIVAEGTPEKIAATAKSYTGRFLTDVLEAAAPEAAPR